MTDNQGRNRHHLRLPHSLHLRHRTSAFFRFAEEFFYVAVAASLALIGLLYFGYTLYDFVEHVRDQGGDLPELVIELLASLLLVFIFTEIINTIRAVIDEKILVAEPFLIVGIVAAIRRMIVLSAEAKDLLGERQFGDAMMELSVLAVTVLLLGMTVWLLRKTTQSERIIDEEVG